jgi:hypothetical protein
VMGQVGLNDKTLTDIRFLVSISMKKSWRSEKCLINQYSHKELQKI